MTTTAFFKLTNADWLEFFKRLSRSDLGILLHLKTLNPFGDRAIEINTADLASILSLSRRAVQRGLKTLKDLNIIKLRTEIRCTFQTPPETTEKSTQRQECRLKETPVASTTKMSQTRQECRKRDSNPAPRKQSDGSQTITDKLDFSYKRDKSDLSSKQINNEEPDLEVDFWVEDNIDNSTSLNYQDLKEGISSA